MDWRHRAACRDEDPELFFPVGNSGPALLQIAEAKAVCFRCPVASHCLSWALNTRQDDGVWGGMSEDERRTLVRRRKALAQNTETTSDASTDDESDAEGPADSPPSEPAGPPSVNVELCIEGRYPRAPRDVRVAAMRHLMSLGWTRTRISKQLHINGSLTKELFEQLLAEGTPTPADLVMSTA